MRPHVEQAFGRWDDDAQRERFSATTDPATHEIVQVAGEPVGCLWVREHPDALELVRLYLLPQVQNRGLGSALLVGLLDRARREGRGVRLRVLKQSPARRFYERHGFVVVDETEAHHRMHAEPA